MPRVEKELMLKELREFLKDSEAVFMVEYSGISANEFNLFRKELKKQGGICRVFKNSLLKTALGDEPFTKTTEHLSGPSLLISTSDDFVNSAKIVANFTDMHKGVNLKAGVVEGSFVTGEGITHIAKLPPKEVLLSKLLGGFLSPVSHFVRVINAPVWAFVNILSLISKQTGGDNDGREGN
jgi:large subunit ribosomal protein L10